MCYITVPAGYTILLTVNSFITEANYDKLYIYDGSSIASLLLATWSGRVDAGRKLESSGNSLTAVFVTDASSNLAGFSIGYSQSNRTVCLPPNYSGPDGILLSPGFSTNQNYHSNMNCMYQVTVPANYMVLLTVNSFATEYNYDKLYIYDGSSTVSPLLAEWSGTIAAGRQLETNGNTLTAQFVTDHSTVNAGFSISYSQSNGTACLSPNYSGPDGTLLSPGFSTNQNYRDNINCMYQVTVPANYSILLTVNSFITEFIYDKLFIYDGASTSAPLLAEWSGRVDAGKKLQSSGNTLTAKFVTDASSNQAGFSISYSQSNASLSTSVCLPSNYSGPDGVLLSPGFSTNQNYHNNINCMYQVTVPANYTILITVNSFITESDYDKLYIYDGSSAASTLLAEWSGTIAATRQLESTGNTLTAKFVTDGSTNYAGFSLNYSQSIRTVCLPPNYSGPDGVLLSPGFSTNQHYRNNMICMYRVSVPANYTIQLTINSFVTEYDYDRLYIYDGLSIASTLLA
uniref:CUB domain-containing protein n=1 Tax=Plectus sambesii TaxID=2011161 RepID=A0A914WEX7_9BILA